MKQTQIGHLKARREKTCAKQFIKWYNRKYGTNYMVVRATDYFPQIRNKVNWDFVACSTNDLDNKWFALEVKAIIDPKGIIQMTRWKQILKRLSAVLGNQLNGKFFVWGVPILRLEQNQVTELRKVLRKVLTDNISTINQLKKGDRIDLGLQIHKLFQPWPMEPHLEMKPSPHLIHKPRYDSSFTLYKSKETGSAIEIGISPVIIFRTGSLIKELTDVLLEPVNEDLPKVIRQLRLAKEMGANKTICLLDLQTLVIDSEDIEQHFHT